MSWQHMPETATIKNASSGKLLASCLFSAERTMFGQLHGKPLGFFRQADVLTCKQLPRPAAIIPV